MRILMSFVMMVFFFGGQAVAEDDPCAREVGAGYGLCYAYCVAMDCDDPEAVEASDGACEKVRDYYIRFSEKLELPCIEASCPAWTHQEVNNVDCSSVKSAKSYDDRMITTNIAIIFEDVCWYFDENYHQVCKNARVLEDIEEDEKYMAFYKNLEVIPNVYRQVEVTYEEYVTCKSEIEGHVMP
jgi:hypothetical protein